MRVRMITDSASDIAEKIDGVTVLPMPVSFGEETFEDGVDLSHAAFYDKLTAGNVLPTTSQVTPFRFEEAFEAAVAAGETVVAVTLSSKLSGTFSAAKQASAAFPDKVFVVDSESAAMGERALVDLALRLRDAGLTAAEIAEKLDTEKKRIRLVALVDTLDYLKKGGRVSAVTAFAGGLLSIKPVIALRDGEVVVLGKARGSRAGNNLLIEEIDRAGGIDFSMPFYLGYTGNDDTLLKQYIEDSRALWEGKTDTLPIKTVGGTIGTHAGPGAIAIAFFCKRVKKKHP